jgi:transcriptional regulator with GAF, ATPase, and Fis domain
LSAPDPLFERTALTLLRGSGVALDPAAGQLPPGSLPASLADGHRPGLVFFDCMNANLADTVRQFSGAGIRRVLAIATPRASLAPDDAWRLLSEGASDVFAWDHSATPADEVAARLQRWAEVEEILESSVVRDNLVGKSPAWSRVLRQIIEVARFTDCSILVTGESGTGKELTARLVHTLDTRDDKGRLVVTDCTTVVPTLSGSEFFGHERGAFTGAVAPRDGAFALADGGTLFLDEVGELPARLQAELLRVIQEGTYKRVGSDTWRTTQFRLVCATNRRLDEAQAHGTFRKDLYHRIAAWVCELPPLRDRVADILPLARYFLQEFSAAPEPPELDPAVRQFLLEREYHGNVRELRQVVHRLHTRHVGTGPITVGDVPDDERSASTAREADWKDDFTGSVRRALSHGVTLREIGRAAQDAAIQMVLTEEGGSVKRASQRLGVSDRALQMRRSAARIASGQEPRQVTSGR